MWILKTLFASCTLLFATFTTQAEIRIGTSLPLSGPAQSLGKNMAIGIETYFSAINAKGGIAGQQLRLVKYDDGYIPNLAAENMHKLIDKDQVIAVMGNVGTSTAVVTVPIANAKKTLLFGSMTGANLLRKNPPDRYVMNYRASYENETAALIEGLAHAGIRPHEIAFFTQNDAYGDAGYNGSIKALKEIGYSHSDQLPHVRYERNTLDVEEALLKLLDSSSVPPRAIIMVGTYAPCAKFIRLARRVMPQTLFLNLSFVNAQALSNALGDAGNGVIVSQVVPLCTLKQAICLQYLEDLKKYAPQEKPGFVSMEGYIIANLLVNGLRNAGDHPSRESLITAMESIKNYNIGTGETVTYSNTQHTASKKLWATMINKGEFQLVNWDELAKNLKQGS